MASDGLIPLGLMTLRRLVIVRDWRQAHLNDSRRDRSDSRQDNTISPGSQAC